MPKFAPSVEVRKIASRAALLKRGFPLNGRLQTMARLIQAIENRIYNNADAARKAKSMMNAIGVLLQELPALLEKADEEHDGAQYVLFDIGKGGNIGGVWIASWACSEQGGLNSFTPVGEKLGIREREAGAVQSPGLGRNTTKVRARYRGQGRITEDGDKDCAMDIKSLIKVWLFQRRRSQARRGHRGS